MLIILFKNAENLLSKILQFLNFRQLVYDLWLFKYTELWLFDLRIWIISLYLTNVENYKSPTISQKNKNYTSFRKEISWIFQICYQIFFPLFKNTKKGGLNRKITKKAISRKNKEKYKSLIIFQKNKNCTTFRKEIS